MSRYYERYDQFGNEPGTLFESAGPSKPFNQEAFNRLLDAVARAGEEHAEWMRYQHCLRQLPATATNDR